MAYLDVADKLTLDLVKTNTDKILNSSIAINTIVNKSYPALSSTVESELISVSGSGLLKSLYLSGFASITIITDDVVTKIINMSSSSSRDAMLMNTADILKFDDQKSYYSMYTSAHDNGTIHSFVYTELEKGAIGETIQIGLDNEYTSRRGALILITEPIAFKNVLKITSRCLSGKTVSLKCAYSLK